MNDWAPHTEMRRISDGVISVELPAEWNDITDTFEDAGYPWTIARDGGSGALQFSASVYRGGKVPQPTVAELRQMLEEWAVARGTVNFHSLALEDFPILLAAVSIKADDYAIRAWYLSQDGSFALATYTCRSPVIQDELFACEQIVRTLQFNPTEE